jgi:hypothetical protein
VERIILEFIGGSWDGMNLHSPSDDPVEAALAERIYLGACRNGKGRQVVMPANYATQRGGRPGLRYFVTGQTKSQEEILVRLECFGGPERRVRQAGEDCSVEHVVLQFRGGPLAGEFFHSRSSDYRVSLAVLGCFLATERGQMGKTCQGSPFAQLRVYDGREAVHLNGRGGWGKYEVTDRQVIQDCVLVELSHVEQNDQIPSSISTHGRDERT